MPSESLASSRSDLAAQASLEIVVTDSGAGINEEDQRRMFNEIVQFNPELLQKGGGSGLGLYISKRIMDAHGGSIRVFSEGLGKGSSLHISIPMQRQPSESPLYLASPGLSSNHTAAPLHAPRRDTTSPPQANVDSRALSPAFTQKLSKAEVTPPSTPASRTPQMTPRGVHTELHFLVVDDSAMSRKMICRFIRSLGRPCVLYEAENGLEAYEKVVEWANEAQPKEFDAIFIDSIMPVMDGPAAVSRIRAIGFTGAIFGVTGNSQEPEVEHFVKSGVNEVYTKPIEVKALGGAILSLYADREGAPIREGASRDKKGSKSPTLTTYINVIE